MIDTILMDLSNNKLFGGCVMLLTNIGGRYLALELPDNMEKLFSNYFILRYLVLFSIFFMATRDIKISILLSLLFFIIIKYAINEKSNWCILKKDNKLENNGSNNIQTKISEKDYLKAREIVMNYNKQF
jgi:hypothetical protein